jgi:H+-transporting ATPase
MYDPPTSFARPARTNAEGARPVSAGASRYGHSRVLSSTTRLFVVGDKGPRALGSLLVAFAYGSQGARGIRRPTPIMRAPPSNVSAPDLLVANVHVGLSNEQAHVRRQQYGPNEVVERKPRALFTFLSKFWGLSAWMLEAIAALSWVLHRYADLGIATALLALNATIAFVQQRRAEGVVDALRRRLQVNARVLRDGHWQTLAAREVVPGDVIRLRQGDVVPADIRLLTGTLSVDQSVLTGESEDAKKAADATLYSGSVIRHGEATGLATATGART